MACPKDNFLTPFVDQILYECMGRKFFFFYGWILFYVSSGRLLGFLVSDTGIMVDPLRVEEIL
jgi:hypothetical protein